MPWVITFVFSWILFLLTVDKSKLKYTIWSGLAALTLASFVDWGGQKLDLYQFSNLIIPWFGCSAFYKFGPVFTMGIIFSQYVPNNKWLQIFHILIFSSVFLTLEFLIINTHVAEYVHWSIVASMVVDILTLTSLTWLTKTFIRAKEFH